MAALVAALVVLVGCGHGAGGVATEAPRPGGLATFAAADDGPAEATVEDVIDTLPPCEALDPDGRVDLIEGCADGGCVGMTADRLEESWGDATCSRLSSLPTQLHCGWPSGAWARFDDRDEDGTPDADDRARPLYLEPPHDGATSDGLGVGASLSCFVEVLGYPDDVTLRDDGAGWRFRSMAWSDPGVQAFDLHGDARAAVLALTGTE